MRLVKAPRRPPEKSWQSVTCPPDWKGAASTEVLKQEPGEQDAKGGQRGRPEHTGPQSGFTLDFMLSKRKSQASLVAQTIENRPAMPEAQVRSLGWKDDLEEEMATHASILAWEIPGTKKPNRLHSL